MSEYVDLSSAANIYVHESGGEAHADWSDHEAKRLATMGAVVASVTRGDLMPLFDELGSAGTVLRFVDIGAGSDTTTEELCAEHGGIEYIALDGKQDFLDQRPTDEARKILADVGSIPSPDGHFDITFSRAVTAWQKKPKTAIAEQLRVTRLGGVAVFTEFDWTHSGATPGSEAQEAIMAARSTMMLVLTGAKFNPGFGANLGEAVAAVIAERGVEAERIEVRHELPQGDYKNIFIDAAENVLLQLKAVGRGQAAVFAGLLESCIEKIKAASSTSIRLPALVTEIVRISPQTAK